MACSSIELKGINLGCKDHTGGIKEVYLVKESDIASIQVDEMNNVIEDIQLNEMAKFKTYKFRKGTSYMNSTSTSDEANGTFAVQTDLFLQFSKMDKAKRSEVMALCIDSVKGVVLDNNGEYWLVGYDAPISASQATGATGTAFGDFGGYQVTLQDNSKAFPYPLSDNFISTFKTMIESAPVA